MPEGTGGTQDAGREEEAETEKEKRKPVKKDCRDEEGGGRLRF